MFLEPVGSLTFYLNMFGMAYESSQQLWELADAAALAQQAASSTESGAAPAEAAPTAMPGAGTIQGGSSSQPTQATAAPASRQPVQAARDGLAQQNSDQDSNNDESDHEPLENDPLQAIKVSRVKAAKAVKPGCNGGRAPQWKQWPAGMYLKPTNAELQDEIVLRDPKQML